VICPITDGRMHLAKMYRVGILICSFEKEIMQAQMVIRANVFGSSESTMVLFGV